MEMTILYLFFVLVKNSRVQEPNIETDHLESSTSGSVNLLNQSFDTRFQPTRQDVCWSGGHALLHQVVQNQPDQPDGQVCSAYQRQAHVSSSSNAWRPTENVVTVPLTPHPSSTSKMGEELPIHLSTPGMVELCGYNPAIYNTHIGAAMYSSCQNRPSH